MTTKIDLLKQEIDNFQILYDGMLTEMNDYYVKGMNISEKLDKIKEIIEAKHKEIELIKSGIL